MKQQKDTRETGNKKRSQREIRCHCGSLVAKLLEIGVELKCRRCKRLAVIPLEAFEEGTKSITVNI
ncbi:MAG TPA: hypothetical protein VGB26_11895 [Nitrospiria bacterium]|jgi:phage FluMu protein Com